MIACIGCRAQVGEANGDGPEHAYVGASPGCWAIFGEVRAREYSLPGYAAVGHRLTTDAYMVQHPGVEGRQSSQSVWVHLLGLYLVLEGGLTPQDATAASAKLLAHDPSFRWLTPPADPGAVTIVDVAAAQDAEAHVATVRRWADVVWQSWAPEHASVRALAESFSRSR